MFYVWFTDIFALSEIRMINLLVLLSTPISILKNGWWANSIIAVLQLYSGNNASYIRTEILYYKICSLWTTTIPTESQQNDKMCIFYLISDFIGSVVLSIYQSLSGLHSGFNTVLSRVNLSLITCKEFQITSKSCIQLKTYKTTLISTNIKVQTVLKILTSNKTIRPIFNTFNTFHLYFYWQSSYMYIKI